MFCPNCGQQQVTDSTKFCPRCGIAISGLAEWLASGGAAAAWAAVMRNVPSPDPVSSGKEGTQRDSRRPTGIRRGVKLMFLSGVMAPIFFGLSIIFDSPGPLLVPLTVFLAGFAWMVYSHLFGDQISPASVQETQPQRLAATFGGAGLPPASNLDLNNVAGQQVRTKELVQPPSVTEHTTRLLDRD